MAELTHLDDEGNARFQFLLQPQDPGDLVKEARSAVEAIDGIARGAGMALDEILLINARTDVRAMVSAELAAEAVPACTALALTGTEFGLLHRLVRSLVDGVSRDE